MVVDWQATTGHNFPLCLRNSPVFAPLKSKYSEVIYYEVSSTDVVVKSAGSSACLIWASFGGKILLESELQESCDQSSG